MVALNKPRFRLGRIVATPLCLSELEKAGQTPLEFLQRHVHGEWGKVCEDDRQANEDALRSGDRIVSVYQTTTGVKIYCITEWDRSVTTLLCASEY